MKRGWEIRKLSEVCSTITDGTHQTPKYFDSGYIFLSSKNVKTGKIDWENVKYLDESQHVALSKRLKPQLNDILLAKNGTTGVAALVDKVEVFDIYVSLALLRPTSVINPRLLLYFINSPMAKSQFNKRLKGMGVPNLHLKEIREVQFPFPTKSTEQEEIVEVLDKAFAAIDQAKANIEQNIANAKELFQSKLNQIFSHKGDGWVEVALGEVCENLDSRRVPITKNKRIKGPIPYYGASGVVDHVEDYLFDEDLLLVSEDGANLVARTYPIAFPISGKTWVNNHAHVLKFEEQTTQAFVEHYLNSIRLDDYISGMAQPKLNQKKLKSIAIPMPRLSARAEAVRDILGLDGFTKNLLSYYQMKLASLEELKKSILQKAFAGELT